VAGVPTDLWSRKVEGNQVGEELCEAMPDDNDYDHNHDDDDDDHDHDDHKVIFDRCDDHFTTTGG